MPRIAYQARTLTGEVVEGSLKAHDTDEMRIILSRKGLDLIDFTEEAADLREGPSIPAIGWRRSVRGTALAAVTGQIALMLETGTTVIEALDAVAQQTDDPKLEEALRVVSAEVQAGSSLATSLSAHPLAFNRYYVSAVQTGESSGTLPEVFKRLEEELLKRESVKASIRAAMVYPVILTVLATVAVIFMVTYVLPKFTAIFEQSGVMLPAPTRILLAISAAFSSYWYIIILVFVASIVSLRLYFSSERGTAQWDALILKAPVVGPLAMAIHSSLLLRMLGTLLEAGVPLVETLTIAQGVCANGRFKTLLSNATTRIIRGEPFADSMSETDLFTPATKQMLATGERTGRLPFVMNKMADRLDVMSDMRMKRLSAVVEPLIIIVMGVVIGFIAVSLLLPLFKLTSAMRQGA
jgi:type IV pilus assembly protein PilC